MNAYVTVDASESLTPDSSVVVLRPNGSVLAAAPVPTVAGGRGPWFIRRIDAALDAIGWRRVNRYANYDGNGKIHFQVEPR